MELSWRARAVLLALLMWELGLAIIGFIMTLETWLILGAIVGFGFLAYWIIRFLWFRYILGKRDEIKLAAAGFMQRFLSRYSNTQSGRPQTPIRMKPVSGVEEIARKTDIHIRNFVTTLEMRLMLAARPTQDDFDNCVTLRDWLRSDALLYDSETNNPGVNGFPRYYATDVDIPDSDSREVVIKLVEVNNIFAANFVKNPPQAKTANVSREDDDFSCTNLFDDDDEL
jgi:hypothetical protein